jgi:hypothetical protein
VRDLLTVLLDRNVEVRSTSPYAPAREERASLAVYVDDQVVVRAVAIADLGFSAHAGAAIGLVPATSAETAVTDGLLPESLEENLHEVLTIAGSLLNADDAVPVRLYQVYGPGTQPPTDVAACAQALGRRLDLGVDIAGYGTGRFSLVVLG